MKVPDRSPPRKFEQHVLRRQLFENELFRIASKVVPRKFPPQDRADFISEIVLELLNGGLSVDEMQSHGTRIFSERLKGQKYFGFQSLDDPVYSDNERKTRVDLMTTSEVLSW